MNYRYDLIILKGYCIIFIVLYHNDIYYFKYGYLSVVVFINISGYLSSLSINKRTIFSSLYYRFKRISPSYYFFIVFSIYYLVQQNSINEKDVVDSLYAIVYLFNIRLILSGNDYFLKENKSSITHLWFISVIFQLYIIQVIMMNFFNKSYLYVLLSLVSFLYDYKGECILQNNLHYYNTFIRIWYYFLYMYMKYYFYISLTTAIVIIILLNIYKLYHIFLNVIMLSIISNIICCNDINNYNSNALNYIIIFFGKISYSLYLYHYSFCNITKNKVKNIGLSVVTSTISYYLIENNIKNYSKLFYIFLIINADVIIIKLRDIFSKKNSENNIVLIKNAIDASRRLWCSHCHLSLNDSISDKNILLIGDSHLEQWIPAMLPYTRQHVIMMHYFYLRLNIDNSIILYNKYFNNPNISWILVIFSFSMPLTVNNNRNIKTKIVNMIKYFTMFIPAALYIEDIPKLIANNICLKCYEKHKHNCFTIIGKNATLYPKIIPSLNRTYYVSFNNIICNKNRCECKNGKISIYDSMSHLSPLYTIMFYNYFNKIFSEILNIRNNKKYYMKICDFYVYGKYYYRNC